MNIGVIFAGGAGRRMHSKDKPKQFLEVHGKPIIVHTLEIFQSCDEIDAIVVSIIPSWLDVMEHLVTDFHLSKVKAVVAGGSTGQLSIFNGLLASDKLVEQSSSQTGIDTIHDQSIVLIHDGVRPLINSQVIHDNIEAVKTFGSAITTAPAKETIMLVDDRNSVDRVVNRTRSVIAKAPQSFYLEEILSIERSAINQGLTDVIDSATLMSLYHKPLHVVHGPYENIKITTPDDFYMFRALCDARENSQIDEVLR